MLYACRVSSRIVDICFCHLRKLCMKKKSVVLPYLLRTV